MNLCPSVCTTTYEVVLNPASVVLLAVIIACVILLVIKKIKLWLFLIIVMISLAGMALVSVKINTCDSGCKENNSIEFENELFGEPAND